MRGIILGAALLAASCGSGSASSGLTDGTWDVTFSRTQYSSGTLVVSGNSATLTLQFRDQADEQEEFAVALTGNGGTGTITQIFKGQRTIENMFGVTGGGSFGSLDGDWTVTRVGGSTADAHVHFGGGTFTGGASDSLGSVGYTFMGTLASTVLSGTDSTGSEFAAMHR